MLINLIFSRVDINFERFASEEHVVRLLEVHKDIENKGKYDLTYDELVHGCGMAWRNAPRCVARVQWQSLKVKKYVIRRENFCFDFLYNSSIIFVLRS